MAMALLNLPKPFLMPVPMDRPSKHIRQERILRRLSSDVAVRISTLADEFGVTTETVRRDLDELSEKGLLARTYGGAAVRSIASEPSVYLRAQERVRERQRIAALTADLIKPGDVVMIDAGSTTGHFAHALAQRNIEITIVTNSLGVARSLGSAEAASVILCPGEFRLTEEAVFGTQTLDFLSRFHADVVVIGAGGITPQEIMDADPHGAAVKRAMMARANRSILVADHGKFGAKQFATVCTTNEIDLLVTDRVLPKEYLGLWRDVMVAESDDRNVAA